MQLNAYFSLFKCLHFVNRNDPMDEVSIIASADESEVTVHQYLYGKEKTVRAGYYADIVAELTRSGYVAVV